MSEIPRSALRLILLGALGVSIAGGVPARVSADDGPRALVTESASGATVFEESGPGDSPAPRRLQTLDLVAAGSTVSVERGRRITLLCSTDHLVRLAGPARWRLDEEACRKGRRQPAGTFRGIRPERGRLVRFGDVLALEMTTRKEIARSVPVLLAPRNTALVDRAPRVVWTAVPGALEYEVRVTSLETLESGTLEVEPGEAGCGDALESWPASDVCSVPWSSVAPSAGPPAGTVYVSVGARFAMGGSLRAEEHRPRVRWLAPAARRDFEARLRQLPDRRDYPFLHAALAARAALDLELYEEARRQLLAALAAHGGPPLRVTLGDLYMEIGLPENAAESYRRAHREATTPAVRGAAAYGQGRASHAMHQYGPAQGHFESAADDFGRAGLREERDAAVRSAARTADQIEDGKGR